MAHRHPADDNIYVPGPVPLAVFEVVSPLDFEADANATPVVTTWTTGTGAGELDDGDTVLVEVWTTDAALATPTGYTAETTTGGPISSYYYYLFSKTVGASEAQVTITTTTNEPAYVTAVATPDTITVDSAQASGGSNPWFNIIYTDYYQPSVDGQGTSVRYTVLHSVLFTGSAPDSVFPRNEVIRPYRQSGETDIGDPRAEWFEYPKVDTSDAQWREAYNGGSNPGFARYGVIGVTITDPAADSDIAAVGLQVPYVPATGGVSGFASVGLQVPYVPDGGGVSSFASVGLQVAYVPILPDVAFSGWGIPWK